MTTRIRVTSCLLLALGCASSQHAAEPVRDSRLLPPPSTPEQMQALWQHAQVVFERRCVVCHGCYDAPCQLKLDTFEGIARGASEQRVYDGARLNAAEPTRLVHRCARSARVARQRDSIRSCQRAA